MKIGIITFHDAYNFGGVLQAVALQKAISKLVNDVEIINCIPRSNTSTTFFRKKEKIKNKLYRIYCRVFNGRKKRIELTNKFRGDYMQLSKPLYNAQELVDYAKKYDIVFSGSDQIWNYTITSRYRFYLLNFTSAKTRKISYASSFGVQTLPDEKLNEYKSLLSRYDLLSVREYTGKQLLESLLPDRRVDVVLDPTLLSTKEDWKLMANNKLLTKKQKYVLCYIMPQGKQVEKTLKRNAKKLAKSLNCKVYFLGQRDYYRFNIFEKNFIDVGPAEFLSLFLNADYVITNSFHGVAFSINFQKDFYAILDEKYDNSINSRIRDLLGTLHLEDRIKYHNQKIVINETRKINYSKVENDLQREREYSWNFLKEALKER